MDRITDKIFNDFGIPRMDLSKSFYSDLNFLVRSGFGDRDFFKDDPFFSEFGGSAFAKMDKMMGAMRQDMMKAMKAGSSLR
jgi:hypothetical protein